MKRFPDNSRVCFIGDSLTAWNQVLSRVVDYYRNNFPDSNIKFYNCGTPGARVLFSLQNFENDIAVYKPTHAVISFGINDAHIGYFAYPRGQERYEKLKQAYEVYKRDLRILCEKLEALNVEITVCTPPHYDEYSKNDVPVMPGCYAMMVEYAHIVRDLCEEKGYNCCDYNDHLAHFINFENLFPDNDRVHPNAQGYFRMAECLLKMQGLDIGEYAPIPDDFAEWHQKVRTFRLIYAGENCVLKDEQKTLPPEEMYELIREYVEKMSPDSVEKSPEEESMVSMGKQYLIDKPLYDVHKKEMLELYEKLFAKQ